MEAQTDQQLKTQFTHINTDWIQTSYVSNELYANLLLKSYHISNIRSLGRK